MILPTPPVNIVPPMIEDAMAFISMPARMRSRTASYMQEVYIATDACQQSAEQMGQELRSLNIDAQHQCTLVVAAHSIETAAHLRPAKHDKHHYDYHQCYYHTDFHIGIYIISQLVHRSHPRNEHTCLLQCSEVFIRHIEGLSIYDGGHASGKEHTRPVSR